MEVWRDVDECEEVSKAMGMCGAAWVCVKFGGLVQLCRGIVEGCGGGVE